MYVEEGEVYEGGIRGTHP